MLTSNARRFLPLILVVSVVFCMPSSARADESDDTLRLEPGEYLLHIGNLNPGDCRDTILGGRTVDGQFLPTEIIWGTCEPGPAVALRTRVHVPSWHRMRISLAVQDINSDTLEDLIFLTTGRPAGRREAADSLRALVIFGQSGLDSMRSVNTAQVGSGLQTRPYFALELERGDHLQYPLKRDLSGRASYVLPRLDVGRRDTSRNPVVLTPQGGVVLMRVSPNPARSAAEFVADGLDPAAYRIDVVAVNGQIYHSSLITVDPGQPLRDVVGLADLPSGYYVVILSARDQRIGTYPFVVVR